MHLMSYYFHKIHITVKEASRPDRAHSIQPVPCGMSHLMTPARKVRVRQVKKFVNAGVMINNVL